MNLRERIGSVEEFQFVELAADERFNEAVELARLGKLGASIYLLGYVGEIYLKLSYYRIDNCSVTDDIGSRHLATFNRAQALNVPYPREGFHSQLYWAKLLIEERIHRGIPFHRKLAQSVFLNSFLMYSNWIVSMRYCIDLATEEDFRIVYKSAFWLKENYQRLWS